MHIHFLQHDRSEGLGSIAQWAGMNGISTTNTLMNEAPHFPSVNDFDWLIIMGGPMGTYEEEKYPWLVAEKDFIRESIEQGKIVLGICLGSQLVANVLGSKVMKNQETEIGFFPVRFVDSSRSDLYFSVFPKDLITMHWHGDTFDLPDGAILMASSEITPNQAFRWGEKVFALQFHLEFTPKTIKELMYTASSDLELKGKWIQSKQEILHQLHRCELNNTFLSLFLDEIKMALV